MIKKFVLLYKKGLHLHPLFEIETSLKSILNRVGRGAGVVTEQIANLSTGNRRQGSSPCLSATKETSGCSVARSSRLVWDQEVAGSNPAIPTNSFRFIGNERNFFIEFILVQ